MAFSYRTNTTNPTRTSDPNAVGPLATLYQTDYNINNLFYPRNLQSDTRGHYIIFYINVAQNSQYLKDDNYAVIDKTQFGLSSTVVSDQAGGRTSANYFANSGSTNIGEINIPVAGQNNNFNLNLSRKTKRIKTAIALYMPDTMNVQYGANWQDTSLTSATGLAGAVGQNIGDVYSKLKDGNYSSFNNILSTVLGTVKGAPAADIAATLASNTLGNEAGDFIFHAAGYALNPQIEVLFKGVGMRSFQFDFIFAPHNREEAVAVRDIIETFKFHAAPEVLPDQGMGRYMVPPSEFDIDFMYKNSKNPNIHQVGTCVLTNINVDYAPNGWATFGGEDSDVGFDKGSGAPVQTRMTLQFQETEIVTKQRVLEGY